MSYKSTDLFRTPSDNTIIWRYMSYAKFKDLIERKALFFYSVINYRKNDPNEGIMTDHTKRTLGNTYFRIDGVNATPEHRNKAVELVEKFLVVNCWGIDKKEVKEKWKTYAYDPRGVAIKTTVGRLKKAFKKTKDDILIGKVRYVDYQIDKYQYSDPFSYSMLKNKAQFEWEHELRLLVLDTNYHGIDKYDLSTYDKFVELDMNKIGHVDFKYIDCMIDYLIDEIYISPWGKPQFLEEISDFLMQHNISKPVHRSFYTGRI